MAPGSAEGLPDGLYAAALAGLPGIGPTRLRRVVEHFGAARRAWQAPAAELARVAGLAESAARALADARQAPRLVELARSLSRAGARVVTLWDAGYPVALRQMPEPPPVLFVRGELKPADAWAVAIVGSRSADVVGLLTAERLAGELASAGFTVVSGLAAGVDQAAHRGALSAGGRTIGVLGCGIDQVYPRQHQELYQRVARQGALLSEYPPGTPPAPWQFALRNRIIAGLSAAVVVVEARANSGAIATALLAQELSREVLAVPGDILRATCRGSNRLLADGARICLTVDDVLEAATEQLRRWGIGPQGSAAGTSAGAAARSSAGSADDEPALSEGAARLWSALGRRPQELEELSARTGEAVGTLLNWLTELEVAGRAVRLPDGRWLRCQRRPGRPAFSPCGPSL